MSVHQPKENSPIGWLQLLGSYRGWVLRGTISHKWGSAFNIHMGRESADYEHLWNERGCVEIRIRRSGKSNSFPEYIRLTPKGRARLVSYQDSPNTPTQKATPLHVGSEPCTPDNLLALVGRWKGTVTIKTLSKYRPRWLPGDIVYHADSWRSVGFMVLPRTDRGGSRTLALTKRGCDYLAWLTWASTLSLIPTLIDGAFRSKTPITTHKEEPHLTKPKRNPPKPRAARLASLRKEQAPKAQPKPKTRPKKRKKA